jgi:hypothetical protein
MIDANGETDEIDFADFCDRARLRPGFRLEGDLQ